jgi:nucleoid-associated protein YgaU
MRYKNQEVFTNINEAYRHYLKSRGDKKIKQYDTPRFRHPTAKDAAKFNTINYIWGTGDRYYKLAAEYYDDPTMWWVIALYNQKPTEFHLKLGDVVFIPTPLESVLFHIGY